MTRYVNDNAYDAVADHIIAGATRIIYFDVFTTVYATAEAAKLAEVAVVGGDFTKANGDVSGRKLTTAAKNSVPVTGTGNINHAALVNDTDTIYAIADTPSAEAVQNGDTVNMPQLDWYEIRDIS